MKATKFVSVLAVLIMLSCSGAFLFADGSEGTDSSSSVTTVNEPIQFFPERSVADRENVTALALINGEKGAHATLDKYSEGGKSVFRLTLKDAKIESKVSGTALDFIRYNDDPNIVVQIEIEGDCSIATTGDIGIKISEYQFSKSQTGLIISGKGSLSISYVGTRTDIQFDGIEGGRGATQLKGNNGLTIDISTDKQIRMFIGMIAFNLSITGVTLDIHSDNEVNRFVGMMVRKHESVSEKFEMTESAVYFYSNVCQVDGTALDLEVDNAKITNCILDIHADTNVLGINFECRDFRSLDIIGSLVYIVADKGLSLNISDFGGKDLTIKIDNQGISSVVVFDCQSSCIDAYITAPRGRDLFCFVDVSNSELQMYAEKGKVCIQNDNNRLQVKAQTGMNFSHASTTIDGDFEEKGQPSLLDANTNAKICVGYCYDMVFYGKDGNRTYLVDILRVSPHYPESFKFEALADYEGNFYNKFTSTLRKNPFYPGEEFKTDDGTEKYLFDRNVPMYTFSCDLDIDFFAMYVQEPKSEVSTDTIEIKGYTTGEKVTIKVNGESVGRVPISSEDYSFSKEVQLEEGKNKIVVTAYDGDKDPISETFYVTYTPEPSPHGGGTDNTAVMAAICACAVVFIAGFGAVVIFRK